MLATHKLTHKISSVVCVKAYVLTFISGCVCVDFTYTRSRYGSMCVRIKTKNSHNTCISKSQKNHSLTDSVSHILSTEWHQSETNKTLFTI